jgi:phage-related protein
VAKQPDSDPPKETLFRIRPTKQARREDIFQTEGEKLWVISQLKLLEHWPLDERKQTKLGSDLDYSKVQYRNETFFELRLDDQRLHKKNLRIFFWVWDESRTIWVIHGYWKKTNRIEDAVKTLVARRIKNLKGGIQDGSIK